MSLLEEEDGECDLADLRKSIQTTIAMMTCTQRGSSSPRTTGPVLPFVHSTGSNRNRRRQNGRTCGLRLLRVPGNKNGKELFLQQRDQGRSHLRDQGRFLRRNASVIDRSRGSFRAWRSPHIRRPRAATIKPAQHLPLLHQPKISLEDVGPMKKRKSSFRFDPQVDQQPQD